MQPAPTTIAIVEDNAAVRAELERILRTTTDYRCLCVCPDGRKALELIPQFKPQVVLMDIELPDVSGIECTRRLKELLPDMQILMLTVYNNDELIFKALEAGASGYLLKRFERDEIVQAIEDVLQGGAPMTAEVARKVVRSFRKPKAPDTDVQSLTAREEELMNLLAEGLASKEIADKLSISYTTVCKHLGNIYRKLHVQSRTEAVIKYLKTS